MSEKRKNTINEDDVCQCFCHRQVEPGRLERLSPLLPSLFLNWKNTDSPRRESSQPPTLTIHHTHLCSTFLLPKLRGTMAATTILRAIETKGRRGGEKKRKTGCMQAYFFLTSCLPLVYLNTRTSLSFPVSKLVREHYSIIVCTTQYACYASNILMYH